MLKDPLHSVKLQTLLATYLRQARLLHSSVKGFFLPSGVSSSRFDKL